MHYIDLGLPSGNLWATYNVGADNCFKTGDYFTYNEALNLQNKEEILPAKEDFQELINHCKLEWKELSQCNGYLITGPNNTSIFLPASGDCYELSHYYVNQIGKYWSSTLLESSKYGAYSLYFHCNHCDIYWTFHKNLLTVRLIKKQNNMKKRKIKIDIITAKEWYNSNNESLKTIALQAFEEKELKCSLPKTWEEWAEQNVNKPIYCIDRDSRILDRNLRIDNTYKNSINTKKDAEAHLALMQLHVLRDAYRDSYQKGWKPDVSNTNQNQWNIAFTNCGFEIYDSYTVTRFLSFPTRELAEEFLKNFKELIEKVKDLI